MAARNRKTKLAALEKALASPTVLSNLQAQNAVSKRSMSAIACNHSYEENTPNHPLCLHFSEPDFREFGGPSRARRACLPVGHIMGLRMELSPEIACGRRSVSVTERRA